MVEKLRFGMVGGGNGGNIGNSHRRGAAMDNMAILSAGCFTRNMMQNQKDGQYWGVTPDRIYPTYQEMAQQESQRADGIDFVSIVTPNATHYEIVKCFLEHGIHVMCEKPFTLEIQQAEELKALASKNELHIGIAFTYAHYPVLQECRELIAHGAIGRVIDVVAAYPQDWMILGLNSQEENFTQWIGDPKKSGNSNVTAAMGVHLYYLIRSMTGLTLEKVLADFSYYPESAPLETTARILLAFSDHTHGLCWTSNTAIGHDCTVELKIYGEKGAIEWSHGDMGRLKVSYLGGPVQIFTANRDYLTENARRTSRIPAGHPEGFYEAFANIYHEFCRHLLDEKNGVAQSPSAYFYPKAQDGVDAVRFVHACVNSHANGNIWVALQHPAQS